MARERLHQFGARERLYCWIFRKLLARGSCSPFSGEEAASASAGVADEHGRVVLLPFGARAASLLDVWEASGAVLEADSVEVVPEGARWARLLRRRV